MNEKPENEDQKQEKHVSEPVNEHGGFYFSSSVKIYDPNTTEVLVQMRGDN